MSRYLFPSLLLGAVAVACGGTTATPRSDDPQSSDQSYSSASSASSKKKVGGVCKSDSDCPATAYCNNFGYGPARCHTKSADGSYCSDARECQCGGCTNYVCVSVPACAKTGAGCTTDVDCCAGSCTYDSYGPATSHCYAPQANGESCSSDRGCTSGHCDHYVCKPVTRASLGAGCKATADCCGTGFCDTSTYGPSKCTAPRAAGAWCNDAAECQSGSCVSYLCTP